MRKNLIYILAFILVFSSRVLAEKIQYTSFFPNPLGEFKELKLVPLDETVFYTPPPASIIGTACTFPGRMFYSVEEDKLLSCNKSHFGLANTYVWGYLPGIWQYDDGNVFLSDSYYTNATSLGIGVAGDEITNKLTLGYDGSIIAAGTFNITHPAGSFNVLTTGTDEATETGTRFIWYPEKASFRVGGIKNDAAINTPIPAYDPTTTPDFFNDDLGWKDANIGDYSAVFGVNNEVLWSTSTSAILGGEYGRIVTGSGNVIINAPYHAFLNDTDGYDVSLGGKSISGLGYNFVGGYGSSVLPNLLTSVIRNSRYSTTLSSGIIDDSAYSFIGSAVPNPDTSYNPADLTNMGLLFDDDFDASILGSACGNSDFGTILSAYALMSCSRHAFIGSGSQHLLNESPSSVILGGKRNTIQGGAFSMILGGENNTTGQSYVFLDDGDSVLDIVPATHQIIGGGKGNRALTEYSLVMGGEYNSAGSLNEIVGPPTEHATHATVVGGQANMAFGLMSYIGGGNQNRIGSACFDDDDDFQCDSAVGNADPCTDSDGDGLCSDVDANDLDQAAGIKNIIGDPTLIDGQYSTLLGGQNNTITGDYGFIGSGRQNTISGDYSVIEGGAENTVNSTYSWGFGKNLTVDGERSWAWSYTHTATATLATDDSFIIYNDTAATGADPIYVGIQTLDPQAALDVVGNVTAKAMILSTNGSATGTPKDLKINELNQIGYIDLAEVFSSAEGVSPGDLVVLDTESDNIFLAKSRQPYDHTIVGVVSTSPALVFEEGKIISDFSLTPELTQKPPVALSGQVPCKVSLENGAINYGDLLTTSSTPGHAMRATDRDKSFGAVVGKALEPFNKNSKAGDTTGVIKIFVSLQ